MDLPTKLGAAMNIRTIVFSSTISLVFLLASPLLAGERTDVIVMKNGDRITCEVKGLNADSLTVSLDYVEERNITLQWSKVARLNSTRLLIVQTEDGSVYTGRISTAETPGGRPVRIQVAVTPDKRVELDQLQVVKISETSQNFWQRLNGDVETGIIFSKGNDSTQYSIGTHIEYPRERWLARANFDSTLSVNTNSNNSTRNQFEVDALRLLRWNNWFYQGVSNLLQSSVQGIHLQTTVGGGIGHYFLNTNSTKISVTGGLAWQNTAYKTTIPPQAAQNLAAGLVFAEANIFKFKKTNLDATALLIPSISEAGRVRFNTNVSYYVKLFSNLRWNMSFYSSWDNRPPPGLSGSDYGTSSGLSWKFGNR
jgi:hypothetical protein